MGRRELAVMIAAVSLTAAVCLNISSRGATTAPIAVESGRYQLCSGTYQIIAAGKDIGVRSEPHTGLFKIDSGTGEVWEFAKVYVSGKDVEFRGAWEPVSK